MSCENSKEIRDIKDVVEGDINLNQPVFEHQVKSSGNYKYYGLHTVLTDIRGYLLFREQQHSQCFSQRAAHQASVGDYCPRYHL